MAKKRHGGGIVWVRAPEALIPNVHVYQERVTLAIFAVAEYMAQVILNYAKQNAKWTDRTANARNALHAIAVMGGAKGKQSRYQGDVEPETESIVNVAAYMVFIYLSHGMKYGKYLETIKAGKWGIIMAALQGHYGQVMQMLREVLR